MTKKERHERDLKFLRKDIEPDMSPEAVTERMQKLNELCRLAYLLRLPDIEYFFADYRWSKGRDN